MVTGKTGPVLSLTPPKPTGTIPQQSISIRNPTQRMSGFSSDSKYYLHLESWRDTGAGVPHVRLQIVEISANSCVSQGCVATKFGEADAGLGLEVAENQVLQQTQALRQTLQLSSPVAGVSLPIISRSQTTDGDGMTAETVLVQFAINRPPVEIQLRQRGAVSMAKVPTDQASTVKATMQLAVRYLGRQRSLDSLENLREQTLTYSIREVLLGPDRTTFVVLITATRPDFEGYLGSTLVQSFKLAQ
jgi:hypothetical protein